MVLTDKFNRMESAAIDVEMDVATVKIRDAGFPLFYLWVRGRYGFPNSLADVLALNTYFPLSGNTCH